MDGIGAAAAATSWIAAPDVARRDALSAAAADDDLLAQLTELAERDELTDFLAQTERAVDLAEAEPTFAEQLDPLLTRIRDALAELPSDRLSRVERDAVEDTQARLEAYLGAIEPPPETGEVPGGGLDAHEDAGGHLIERHVGKSEQDLIDRVRRENISAASSFRDLPDAERLVTETLAENQDRIDAWVDGQGGNRLVVNASFDASTGISVRRGESQAEDVFSVRLVLERSEALGIGYRIVTGYPSAP